MIHQSINSGNYFLHYSLLKEASESWIIRKQQTNAGIFFMNLFGARRYQNIDISVCDRTIKRLEENKEKLAFTPALFDIINERSLKNYANLDDDEYSLKVASLSATIPHTIFFITTDSEKQKIVNLANNKGYLSLRILSPADFGFKAEIIENSL